MSPFWILLELKVTEVLSGENWSYKTYKAPVKSQQTDTQFFFTGPIPFLSPNQQCQSNDGKF